MPDREHRVREVAHRLWEEDGRPCDQDKRHWATAERIVDAEESARAASDLLREQARPAGTSKRAPARRPAKKAAGPTAGATSH
jgi:hypothetical protein